MFIERERFVVKRYIYAYDIKTREKVPQRINLLLLLSLSLRSKEKRVYSSFSRSFSRLFFSLLVIFSPFSSSSSSSPGSPGFSFLPFSSSSSSGISGSPGKGFGIGCLISFKSGKISGRLDGTARTYSSGKSRTEPSSSTSILSGLGDRIVCLCLLIGSY